MSTCFDGAPDCDHAQNWECHAVSATAPSKWKCTMPAIFAKLVEKNPLASMPFSEPSIENNFLSGSNAMRRPIGESTMDCASLTWHTTHIHRKSVGDSGRAVCSDKLHVQFGRGGIEVLSNQDPVSY